MRVHFHFNILAPLAADSISADYPYLRQITECAADLVSTLSELSCERDIRRDIANERVTCEVSVARKPLQVIRDL